MPSNTPILITNETQNSHNDKEEFNVNNSKEENDKEEFKATISKEENATQSLPFDVNRVLQQNQKRQIGHMEYFTRDTPLPAVTMENPALVVIGCSRLDAILNTLGEVSSLPGIHQYSLYLSLGCLESINKTVYSSISSSIDYFIINNENHSFKPYESYYP